MRNLKISHSIYASLLLLLAICIFNNILAVIYMKNSVRSYQEMDRLQHRAELLGEVRSNILFIRSNLNYMLAEKLSGRPLPPTAIADSQKMDKEARQKATEFVEAPKSSQEIQRLSEVIGSNSTELLDFLMLTMRQVSSGEIDSFNVRERFNEFDGLYQQYKNHFEANKLTMDKDSKDNLTSYIEIAIAALIIIVFLFMVFLRWLRKDFFAMLQELGLYFKKISAGDLAFSIPRRKNNELGELMVELGNMQTSLKSTITSVKESAVIISNNAKEIAIGNNDLSSRTEQQASALQETAASMEEIKTTVSNNTDNAYRANQLAATANQTAQNGAGVMHNVIDTMKQIEESAHKIADINNVINGIASQTNILALNAAVEAARAGEQGRGFAVVAAEVRNLSARSSDAAKEINTLIKYAVDNVEQGSRLVSQAGETMAEIVSATTQVSNFMQEISIASEEQSTGINQVAVAINQMDVVTQQNAALVQESAAATNHMDAQARQLTELVEIFKVKETVTRTYEQEGFSAAT
ncbi:Methyl-accepting chemotaxis protein I [Enterobacter cancerogenus]|uniref:methyl-accepting chemotaxis protein n=1 Tax=Enterobacter cancerogenus TaxID=69218 RepID=UPI001928BE12|nr:methyl-accepting chemotaxis protein [Enterobacter cancerogenus]CAD5358493.1 Methyl-accepting chemotaxis protein I [Enterobacter cancerogenus]